MTNHHGNNDDDNNTTKSSVTNDSSNHTIPKDDISLHQQQQQPQSQSQQQQLQILPNHHSVDDESLASCSSCLWTGVITCFGLSAYFAHIAFDDSVVQINQATTTTNPSSLPITKDPNKMMMSTTTYHDHHHHHPINNMKTTNITSATPKSSLHHHHHTVWIRSWIQQQWYNYHHVPIITTKASFAHNKPVLLCISVGWAMVGVYRWYLG